MKITIELPDDVEALLRADATREKRAVEAIAADRLSDWYGVGEGSGADPVAVEAIREGIEDIKAGRTISIEEYERHKNVAHRFKQGN
jgi:fructose-1,6-bisphosphatase/sedoheptulose 1,7-bisphosphatase-like protein